jgi:hypothetical protein
LVLSPNIIPGARKISLETHGFSMNYHY